MVTVVRIVMRCILPKSSQVAIVILAGQAGVEIRVPHLGYTDRIQEIHIKVIHILIMLIKEEMVQG